MSSDWDALVAEAAGLGFTVELVEFCESADSPGLLGQAAGVCIYPKRVIRVRRALRPEDRAFILDHEIGHARIHAEGGGRAEQRAHDDAYDADPATVARREAMNGYLFA